MTITYQVLIIGLHYPIEGIHDIEPFSAFFLGRDENKNVYTSFYSSDVEIPADFVEYFKKLPQILTYHCKHWLTKRPDVSFEDVLISCQAFLEGSVPFRLYEVRDLGVMEV